MDRGAWCAIVPGSQRVTERLTLPYKDLVPASHISLEIQLKVRDCLRKNENFHPEEGLQDRKP